MSKRGNRSVKSLAPFVITDWSFSPALKSHYDSAVDKTTS